MAVMKKYAPLAGVLLFLAGLAAGYLARPGLDKKASDIKVKTGKVSKEIDGEESRVIARIGDYDVTEKEFKTRWRDVLTLERQKSFLSHGGPRTYLKEIIEERLLHMEALDRGLDEDYVNQLRIDIETGHILHRPLLKREVREQLKPEEELKAYYEENLESFRRRETVTVRHILATPRPYWPTEVRNRLGDDAKTQDEAKEKIETLIGKLRDGEDFETIARDYSEDASTRVGGLLKPFARGVMSKAFEEEAFRLNPGDISGVIESKYGFHVIKVEEKNPSKLMTYEEARPMILKRLEGEDPSLPRKRYEEFIETLEEKYPVTVDESYFRKEFKPLPEE